jgi:hypothetical protein
MGRSAYQILFWVSAFLRIIFFKVGNGFIMKSIGLVLTLNFKSNTAKFVYNLVDAIALFSNSN